MVTTTDIKIIAERWKKGTRPLPTHEQKYGHQIVQILEKYNGNGLGVFNDPLEAVVFIILIEIMKERDKE